MPAAVRVKPLLLFMLLALAFAGVASAGNGGFAPVPGESENVDNVNDAFYLISAFAIAILLIVVVPLCVFTWRYRSRGRPRDEDGAQIRGNNNLELAWTVGPVVILVIVGSFIFYKLPGVTLDAKAGEKPVEVTVEGRQFYWNYTYANGVITVDRLRAPQGRLVRLKVVAPGWDVNHSYWVPALSGKFDAIPGIENEITFRARRPGIYRGQCAEFCGVQHAAMEASVEVLPADEFDAWLEDEARAQQAGDSDLGKETWEGVCAKCHGPKVAGKIGPPIVGSALLADPNAVTTLVHNGLGAMPPVGRDWTDTQLDALTTYLRDVVSKQKPGGTSVG
jgi:cytochrome c oxidase subunit 2